MPQNPENGELPEFPITGPFGGVQSEMSPSQIEPYGFVDSTNIIFRLGRATVRPGYSVTPQPDGNPIQGIADFFTVNGVHIQVVFTTAGLYKWNAATQTWTHITGGPAFGTVGIFSWDVLNYKLCFSQGSNQILCWDGITASYALTSASAPAAFSIAEINQHLVALNTVEGGNPFPNRYHWSGSGDPTDWTGLTSGLNDVLNNMGPGNGILKLGQQGYGFHQNGIVQVIPTGIGTSPFFFYPIINASQGLVYPYSLDHVDIDGQECGVYVTVDNIVLFNQSSIIPIGDAPIDGRRRLGARTRIFADLKQVNTNQPYGHVAYAINGNAFKSYWLVIPGISTWVYNFDEGNWTRFVYDKTAQVFGQFQNPTGTRWIDMIGSWQDQNQAWNSFVNNPGSDVALGFATGDVGITDFSNYSESSWQIVSAKHTFGDRRHQHAIKKFRLVINDISASPITYTITITNEKGQSMVKTVTFGSGSSDDLTAIVEFNISGLRLQWTITGPVQAGASFVEFAPIYDTLGEQVGGTTRN